MAFKVVEKSGGGGARLTVPAVHLTKNTSCISYLFCKALGLKKVGTKLGVELLHDEESGKFGLQFNLDNPESCTTVIAYTKSHQCQIYLRSMLRGLGYVITKSHAAPVTFDKTNNLWIFEIPEMFKAVPQEIDQPKPTVKVVKKTAKSLDPEVVKKGKRKLKNKLRKTSDIASRE